MKLKSNKKGFTLVEIMIVVVIIGILAALAIPAFQKVRQNAQEKSIQNNLKQYVNAGQQHLLDQGVTIANFTDLVGPGKFINTIKTVAGEDYSTLTVGSSGTLIINAPGLDKSVTYPY